MARKQSAFLNQMDAIRRKSQDASWKTCRQYMTDTAAIALHNLGWGEERIRRFIVEWGKVHDEYFDALRTTPETDYYRSMLDARLIPLCKKEPFIKFEDRYEFLPEMKY